MSDVPLYHQECHTSSDAYHGYLGSKGTYEAEVNLLWTPHNLAALGALRAQIPTHTRCGTLELFHQMLGVLGRQWREELARLSSDHVFQETSARYRAVEPEQWLQRHPEAGSSWPSWPKTLGLRERQWRAELARVAWSRPRKLPKLIVVVGF